METNTNEFICWLSKYRDQEDEEPLPDMEVLTKEVAANYEILCDFDFGFKKNILFTAMRRNHSLIIRQLFIVLPAQAMFDLINKKDMHGNTAIHYAANHNLYDMLTEMLSRVKDSDLSPLQLLLTIGSSRLNTAAHYAAHENNYQAMESMLVSLTDPEERLEFLTYGAGLCNTVIHTAVLSRSIETVKCIQRHLKVEHMYELMKIQTEHSWSVLYAAAVISNTEMISVLMNSLTDEQRLYLLDIIDSVEGYTAKDYAVMLGHLKLEDLLENLTTTSIMRVITTITNQEERKQNLLERLRLKQPLSTQQIQELYPHSDRYVIPRNQKLMKQHAIVLFNEDDRPGADEEASNLSWALKAAGFDVIKQAWSIVRELQKMIVDGLEPVRNSCSFLIVCLMSHGSMGKLQGSDGEETSINTILKLLSNDLPAHVPLVLLIQACQSSRYGIKLPPTCSADPAVYGDSVSNEDRKVVVIRPHTLLLQASLTGEPAYRGKYTGALAAQIRLADDKITLHKMEMEARKQVETEMETVHNVCQIPTTISTLMRDLVLPGKCEEVESDSEPEWYTDSDIDSD